MFVTKRSGEVQPFDVKKISRAVSSAGARQEVSEVIAKSVETALTLLSQSSFGVEDVQDLVERMLIEAGEATVAKSYILYRAERSSIRRERQAPDSKAIEDYINMSKYARYDPKKRRRETWEESCDRLMRMHLSYLPEVESKIKDAFENYVKPKIVLPSMRSLQFGGRAIEVNHVRMYNCSFTLIDRSEVFGQILFLLLSGCGVGYSVQRMHIDCLPLLVKPDTKYVEFWKVTDTIEGWGDALTVLVSSYINPSKFRYVEFDFSGIRVEGSTLAISGGKAPGHIPLKIMLEKARSILDRATGRNLTPLECHDIICYIAECVLSGGIRRSSLWCGFSPDDPGMVACKADDWYVGNPQRAMANNSAIFNPNDANPVLFGNLFSYTKQYGEPGFFWATQPHHGTNPCAEIGLNPVMEGKTGFAFCNLTEINAAAVGNKKEFLDACYVASFLGTLQASYTMFPYLGDITESIVKRDALLGVSITAIMDNALVRDPKVLKEGVLAVQNANEDTAHLIGINTASRLTCIKPSGTASLLLGCVGSGIHPHHSRRYIRRITANSNEPVFRWFYRFNPHMCLEKPNGDWVIEFPVECRDSALTKEDFTAEEFMKEIYNVYEFWVAPGTRRYDEGLTHNVSCTVSIKDSEWNTAGYLAWENRFNLRAMAFLSYVGDKVYPFAPREEIITVADEARWNELISKYREVDYTLLREDDDNTDMAPVCEGAVCDIVF